MLNTNQGFCVIFQNCAGYKIKPQMQESPWQIRRVMRDGYEATSEATSLKRACTLG